MQETRDTGSIPGLGRSPGGGLGTRMVVAKREGREKPVKIEQRKVQGPE